MTYIIISGWWSADRERDKRDRLLGDDLIRSADFHKLWYQAIDRFTNPEKLLIIDSNSPVPPPIDSSDRRIEYLRLDSNAGHSTNHLGKYCGYTRAVLVGIEYALQCDADHIVYVEQDALLFGEGIIEHAISTMRRAYMFGESGGTVQRLQQSLFIIECGAARHFVNRLHSIPARDGEISPEEKFHIAASRGPVLPLAHLARHRKDFPYSRWDWGISSRVRGYDFLPFGYGRTRPIDFNDRFFYFQHGSHSEVAEFERRLGLCSD